MNKSSQGKLSASGVRRRTFIQQSAFAAAALGSFSSVFGKTRSETAPLKAAGYRLPRVEALFDGTVPIQGFDTEFKQAGISDSNTDLFSGAQTLDFTEIGLHPFMLAYANDNFRDYTLLPVFPLRLFRHKSIFIRTGSGIKTPADLRGRSEARNQLLRQEQDYQPEYRQVGRPIACLQQGLLPGSHLHAISGEHP